MARTKNRGHVIENFTSENTAIFYAGIYIRLSREDLGKGADESNSVKNQRKLLDEYCRRHADEFSCVTPYIDDGCTGTDTNREGFQRLIADVMSKKINCVIVKDLSRLSRNYSDAGSLIENLFVQMNVRFISLAENIDSYRNPESVSSILVPITNVMNDNFCYQTSKKIRQVFDYKRRSGEFIGSFAAYGYIKDPNDKHAIIIDQEAADVVRSIFAWFLDGMSKSAIVRSLNSRGILCPAHYKRSKGMSYYNPHADGKPLWSTKTVGDILKNRVYAGDLVQGRQRVKSYKVHKQEQVPQEDWFVVEDTHAAIINRETFNKAQELLKRDTRTAPRQSRLYLFSGFLRCADCGKSMTRSEVKGTVYYFCRTYKDQSKTACTKHSIKHNPLEAAVLYAIRQQIYIAVSFGETMSSINAAPPQKNTSARIDELISAKEKELAKIMRYKQSIYQDWKDGEITHDDYRHMSEDYERQVAVIKAAIQTLTTEQEAIQNRVDTEDSILAAFCKYGTIDKLSREVIVQLIDFIKVHENGNITIRFKFSDVLSHGV